ncbi:hypothetical protein [Nocardioides flavescens]|uniref:Uncharacterized protein n=1 Tax=Nocardioides flavescens TaxID=2691959 RepID=A0A6L7ESM6_9ACTN|nr:hypothetical protein [Nocardioides flavescens]MXG89680.1 hypothetical protein [Nocardioides flavescens]
MNTTLTELHARHQMQERLTRAAAPRIRARSGRHQLADRLRRVADRLDG